MTWLLGTMAGVFIWCALLTGIGGCIRNTPDDPPEHDQEALLDWAECTVNVPHDATQCDGYHLDASDA